MSITIRSRKNKGQRLQKQIVEIFRKETGLDNSETTCFDGDIQARLMGGSGTDVIFSPAAKLLLPFDIECKNKENISIWASLKQAEDNSKNGRIPLVIFKRNHSKIYCALEFKDLLNLRKLQR